MTINPYTLKELRQLTRSRTIAATLVAFLFLCVGAAYTIPLVGIGHSTGSTLFTAIMAFLFVAAAIVVPSGTFIAMMSERRSGGGTVDMTLLTMLSPSAIVDGKLRAAFILMVLFASAALPFAVLANLLHGVGFAGMAETIVMLLAVAAAVEHIVVFLGTMKLSTPFRLLLHLALMGGLLSMLVEPSPLLYGLDTCGRQEYCVVLACIASVCLYLRAFAVALSTPAVAERDAPLRVTTLVLAVAWLVWAAVKVADGEFPFHAAAGLYVSVFGLAACMLALFASVQPPVPSRRIVAGYTGSLAVRMLRWPFSSGAANGFFFASVFGIAVTFAGIAGNRLFPSRFPHLFAYKGLTPLVAFLYFMALLLFWRGVWRVASRFFKLAPSHAGFMAVCVMLFMQSLPHLLSALDFEDSETYKYIPFSFTMPNTDMTRHLAMAAAALGIAILLNILPLVRLLRKELFRRDPGRITDQTRSQSS